MGDRYFEHIVGCLEASIKAAEDGVDCHVPVVTVQGAVDLLKEQDERIEKLTPKDGYNLQDLWKRARDGETLNETELKFLLADWDERNIFKHQKDGDSDADGTTPISE